MSRNIRFSWKALIMAPLAVPLLSTALLTFSSPGRSPFTGFLFLFALGSVVSYAVAVFLFLPCFFVFSMFTPMTAVRTGLLGTALGVVVYGPFIWQEYHASGVDSGPPEITFVEYLRQHAFGWDFWALLAAGLVTAMLYWFLAKRPAPRNDQPAA